MFLYKSRIWPTIVFIPWKSVSLSIHLKNSRKTNSETECETYPVECNFHQPRRTHTHFGHILNLYFGLLLILLIWNQFAMYEHNRRLSCVCPFWYECYSVMYANVLVFVSLCAFGMLGKSCFKDVMERNEANVPHYWYWYGINWTKLTSRLWCALVKCQQMWPNIQLLLRIRWGSLCWPQNRNSVIISKWQRGEKTTTTTTNTHQKQIG